MNSPKTPPRCWRRHDFWPPRVGQRHGDAAARESLGKSPSDIACADDGVVHIGIFREVAALGLLDEVLKNQRTAHANQHSTLVDLTEHHRSETQVVHKLGD